MKGLVNLFNAIPFCGQLGLTYLADSNIGALKHLTLLNKAILVTTRLLFKGAESPNIDRPGISLTCLFPGAPYANPNTYIIGGGSPLTNYTFLQELPILSPRSSHSSRPAPLNLSMY